MICCNLISSRIAEHIKPDLHANSTYKCIGESADWENKLPVWKVDYAALDVKYSRHQSEWRCSNAALEVKYYSTRVDVYVAMQH